MFESPDSSALFSKRDGCLLYSIGLGSTFVTEHPALKVRNVTGAHKDLGARSLSFDLEWAVDSFGPADCICLGSFRKQGSRPLVSVKGRVCAAVSVAVAVD